MQPSDDSSVTRHGGALRWMRVIRTRIVSVVNASVASRRWRWEGGVCGLDMFGAVY
jgi:hypothetical protein